MRPLTVLALALSVPMLLDATIAASSSDAVTAAAMSEAAAAAPAPRYVREAQRALRDLGYRPGPVDGVVGRQTKEALVKYQRSQKIAVTGRLDSETMVRLDIQKRLFQGQARAR